MFTDSRSLMGRQTIDVRLYLTPSSQQPHQHDEDLVFKVYASFAQRKISFQTLYPTTGPDSSSGRLDDGAIHLLDSLVEYEHATSQSQEGPQRER